MKLLNPKETVELSVNNQQLQEKEETGITPPSATASSCLQCGEVFGY